MALPNAPDAPWHQQLVHGLQRECMKVTRSVDASLDHLRRAVTERMPPRPRTPPATSQQLGHAEAFFGAPPPSTESKPSSPAMPRGAPSAAVTKEDVGRATWLFLHTLAAQYPERPTRQQRHDARTLVDVLTRMYPCGECARHFAEVVRAQPPALGCRRDFSQWMCRVHNVVNRSLGKPAFNCDFVEARWAGLECDEEDACSLDLGRRR